MRVGLRPSGTTMVGASVVWPITLTPLGYSNSQPHWKA